MKAKSLFVIIALAVATAVAQHGGMGPGPGFTYDASAETKLTGTIQQINTTDMMCHSGTHLVLKTDKGDQEVALGPAKFLEDQKLDLKKGQTIEVIGAKTTMGMGHGNMGMAHEEMFIARQITVAGKTVNLRDAKGMPAWPHEVCR